MPTRAAGGTCEPSGACSPPAAVGFALLATAGAPPMLIAGTVLGFGAGWGWNGLLVYAVVRSNRNAPAAATGVTQSGLYVGGILGSTLFGLTSERWTFAAGWWLGAALLLAAWVCVLVGERLMHGESHPAPPSRAERPCS